MAEEDPLIAEALAKLKAEDVEAAREAEAALSSLTWGEGSSVITQERLQHFLWYGLPMKWLTDTDHHRRIVAALARAFDHLDLPRYAALCRSDTTAAVLDAYEHSDGEGKKAFLKADAASGIRPPDIDELAWGSVMGGEESRALSSTAELLELAVAGGELVSGARGWKQRQSELVRAHLTTARLDLGALDEVLAPFGACVSESEVPAGTVVVQVGDLIGRSDESARLIACVDRLRNRARARWVQLAGNHELHHRRRARSGLKQASSCYRRGSTAATCRSTRCTVTPPRTTGFAGDSGTPISWTIATSTGSAGTSSLASARARSRASTPASAGTGIRAGRRWSSRPHETSGWATVGRNGAGRMDLSETGGAAWQRPVRHAEPREQP